MGRSRVFFPQEALDQWLSRNQVELTGTELTLKAERRRYRIVEAARILREVSGLEDAHEIVGKVKSVNFLTELGAELLGSSMILGDNAYEIVPGFVGSPLGDFAEYRAGAARKRPRTATHGSEPPESDEELLARFVMHNL
jgi:hypothetical protein